LHPRELEAKVVKLLAASALALFMLAGLGLSDAHAGRCSPGGGGGGWNGGWHGGNGGNGWSDLVKWFKKKHRD
jgi:hypothetical protein